MIKFVKFLMRTSVFNLVSSFHASTPVVRHDAVGIAGVEKYKMAIVEGSLLEIGKRLEMGKRLVLKAF